MTRKTYDFAQCNGCFREERMLVSRGFGGGTTLPDGWIAVHTSDGSHLWDICAECHKEIAAMLFAKERVDRVLSIGHGEKR